MKKQVVILLDEEDFLRLKSLMTHKGERTHLLRGAIKSLIKKLEKERSQDDSNEEQSIVDMLNE